MTLGSPDPVHAHGVLWLLYGLIISLHRKVTKFNFHQYQLSPFIKYNAHQSFLLYGIFFVKVVKKINYHNYSGKFFVGFNFRGWSSYLYHFAGLIFADMCTHAHYVLYNPTYFTGLIFAVRPSSVKTVKISITTNSAN